MLTERRAVRPFGLQGGSDGLPGLNLLTTKNGRTLNIGSFLALFLFLKMHSGSKAAVDVGPGDTITVYTPGGGGFGVVEEDSESEESTEGELTTGVPYRVGGSVIEYQRLMESA